MNESTGAKPTSPWPMIYAVVAILACTSFFFLNRAPVEDDSEPTDNPTFTDIAEDAGLDFHMAFLPHEQGQTFKINLYDHGSGLAVADVDNDDDEDVYFLNQLGANALFLNQGDGTFAKATDAGPIELDDRISVGATFADYDNDGDADLYVTSTRGGNVLFRNDGEGRFADTTESAGLSRTAHSQTAAFVDLDADGLLDLILTNSAGWTLDEFDDASQYFPGVEDLVKLGASPKEYNNIYRNNGDGTFTDVSEGSALRGQGWSGDIAAFDYDEDGDIDLFITNMFGSSQLYRNDGDWKFTDTTKDVLGRTSFGAIGSKVFDIDNDGHLDLLIVDMHSDMWMGLDYDHDSLGLARQHETKKFDYFFGPMVEKHPELIEQDMALEETFGFKHAEVLFGNTLFRARGDGTFEEISEASNLEQFWPWGVATGDFDNDGDEDVFLPCGMGFPFYYWPNYLMVNDGAGKFEDRATEFGIEPPAGGKYLPERIQERDATRSSRCAVTADFDNDGRLDILTNNFNDGPYYFKNGHADANNYVSFRLQGTRSNRDAIGARVVLRVGDQRLVRQVHAAGGYLSHSSRLVHFGLGKTDAVDEAIIYWPSGLEQTLTDFRVNQRNDIVEPKAD